LRKVDKGGGDSYGYTELLGSVNQIVGYLFYFCTVCAYPGLIVFSAGCCERKVFFIARGTDVQYDAHASIVAGCLLVSREWLYNAPDSWAWWLPAAVKTSGKGSN